MSTFHQHPENLRGRAIVYETDDDLLADPSWLSFHKRLMADRPIIESMLRRADLVTVSTPVLARMAGRFNDAVRTVRNAVDPEWYRPADPAEAGATSAPSVGATAGVGAGPRILYYGPPIRILDYGVCRDAVDHVAARTPGSRRVWLGADDPDVRSAGLRPGARRAAAGHRPCATRRR